VVARIPSALSVRLGADAARGLVDLLDIESRDWSNTVFTALSERFERQMIEEGAKFRVELANLGSALRQEMARDRFELLKWMFVFWIGQLAAMSAIMSFIFSR